MRRDPAQSSTQGWCCFFPKTVDWIYIIHIYTFTFIVCLIDPKDRQTKPKLQGHAFDEFETDSEFSETSALCASPKGRRWPRSFFACWKTTTWPWKLPKQTTKVGDLLKVVIFLLARIEKTESWSLLTCWETMLRFADSIRLDMEKRLSATNDHPPEWMNGPQFWGADIARFLSHRVWLWPDVTPCCA